MTLSVRGRQLELADVSLMGIVNASSESFSEPGGAGTVTEQAALALEHFEQGATIVDLGGQSASTSSPELSVDEETSRLVPLIEAIRRSTDGLLSIDTYKPDVARACLAAGADMVNDVSGLRYEDIIAEAVAADAGYVLMHNRGVPKRRLTDPELYDDVVADVVTFFEEKLARCAELGLPAAGVLLDPGIDFSKTPYQTVEVLRRLREVDVAGRPLLLALSRKDFIGAITGQSPAGRDPGTMAAIAVALDQRRDLVIRVHDVGAARGFIEVLDTLRGVSDLGEDVLLDPGLYRELGTR